MNNLNLQTRSWRVEDQNRHLLFNDDEINLYSNLTWDANDNVTKIDFDLQNIGANEYKICKVMECKVDNAEFGDYIAIHLSKKGGLTNGQSNPFLASNSDFGHLNLSKNKFATLLFIVNQESCGNSYSCELRSLTPESKDGAIIVSI
ncbi:hypothetical protein [Flavivirga eckloniae]|uniref:Uncharacterized protein n=1 Tax=Flavivirga eckloniae TaxID=1803846 RepID=A0A2K9PWV4_9FLAO|nr:hypothetical protein [Flavivirga eckloniae]AUP81017.1 hypothetical protein C1H87_20785 [Flavivirga eckloniae]